MIDGRGATRCHCGHSMSQHKPHSTYTMYLERKCKICHCKNFQRIVMPTRREAPYLWKAECPACNTPSVILTNGEEPNPNRRHKCTTCRRQVWID